MDRLLTLEVFARVGETLSFSRAAEGLGLPRSTVSAAVRELSRSAWALGSSTAPRARHR